MIVLAIGAHSDDELYAGELLAKYAEEGHDAYILLSTRGEGGPMDDPPICKDRQLGELRVREAQEAARALRARGETLEQIVERDRVESFHRWTQEEQSHGIM